MTNDDALPGPRILTLDYHEREQAHGPKPDREGYAKRRAARAVVIDSNGAVGLLHAKEKDYYKLPGGGLEGNEDHEQALRREVKEELGCDIELGEHLGHVLEFRDFWELEQISECYVGKVKGEKGEVTRTGHEIEEKFETIWVKDIQTALELVENSKNSSFPNVVFMSLRDAAVIKAAIEVLPHPILPGLQIPGLPKL